LPEEFPKTSKWASRRTLKPLDFDVIKYAPADLIGRETTHPMTAARHSIFISYRRVDSVYAVDQLDERLKLAFGTDAVSRDASSIVPGAVFPQMVNAVAEQ
jgi:hypothetical protein